MHPPQICNGLVPYKNARARRCCESTDRFKYGADEEEYLVMLLWPPAARTPEVVDLARSRINEVADVVQWARFDPGANFSAFLYEVYSLDFNLRNWTWIDMKRDWFAEHAERTGTEGVFALIKLRTPSFWSARGQTSLASHRLKMPIRLSVQSRRLIPDYMNPTQDVSIHATDSVYQTRATRLAARRYLLM